MPELPEVETVTNAIRPYLINRKILAIKTFTEKLRTPLTIGDREDILGICIRYVRRRAKYILIELENLTVIVMHLGMTGSCRIEDIGSPRRRHDHVIFEFDDGSSWRFNDPRRFGSLEIAMIDKANTNPPFFAGLPPEPLSDDFDYRYLRRTLDGRTKSIKSVLMDSRLITGLGNIYVCESLFISRINPKTRAHRLSRDRCERLVEAIKAVLLDAIGAGGTTISDFKSVDGSEGKFRQNLRVYGKEGDCCDRCKSNTIRRIIQSGRSTFYCPACQK